MRLFKKYVLPFLLFIIFAVACSTVPVTGRNQLNIIPSSQMLSMSYQQYGQFLGEHKLSNDQAATNMVKNVGHKIQSAVENYFSQRNMSDQLNGYQWAFNLIESEEVNAWCMPGGKVVIYTGILPVTKDENGLAVVMAHEIAHAVAEHGNERMSQGLIQQFGGLALSKALEKEPSATQQLWMSIYGVGSTIGVMLPYSRLQESEADELGLIFMAMAGYNPQGAISFWQRMAQMKGGQAPPEFLSTHPSDQTRIEDIQKHMPEAMKYYTGN